MKLPSGKIVYPNTPIYEGSNFTWGEATKNCTRYPEDLIILGQLIITPIEIESAIIQTAEEMDGIRKRLGDRPIIVNSWYRNSDVNRQVGGALWSRHQYGDAVDFVATHLSPSQVNHALEKRHTKGGFHTYKNFTHIDWRGVKARW